VVRGGEEASDPESDLTRERLTGRRIFIEGFSMGCGDDSKAERIALRLYGRGILEVGAHEGSCTLR
jgi:hypothetical protein